MRLWHYELISVLPGKQLVSQWRECCAVAGEIAKYGSPRSPLTRKVIEYPILHFVAYTNKVLAEMNKRDYEVSEKSYLRFVNNMNNGKENFWNPGDRLIINDVLFPEWHNSRYLAQCYYNLQEKYDCGRITDEEWEIINCFYTKYFL